MPLDDIGLWPRWPVRVTYRDWYFDADLPLGKKKVWYRWDEDFAVIATSWEAVTAAIYQMAHFADQEVLDIMLMGPASPQEMRH